MVERRNVGPAATKSKAFRKGISIRLTAEDSRVQLKRVGRNVRIQDSGFLDAAMNRGESSSGRVAQRMHVSGHGDTAGLLERRGSNGLAGCPAEGPARNVTISLTDAFPQAANRLGVDRIQHAEKIVRGEDVAKVLGGGK